jgi:hypothetical protein
MQAKRSIFIFNCLLFAAALWWLVRMTTQNIADTDETLGYRARNLVGACLLATYVFLVLQRFFVGKAAIEYILLMPPLILIAAFLSGAALGLFGIHLTEDPYPQAGILHGIFSLIVALRMWRRSLWHTSN